VRERREDAKGDGDLAKAGVKEGVTVAVDESGLVAPSQSESHLEAGVNAEAQTRRREDAMARERREDAKGEKDLAEGVVMESELVAVGQSESNEKAGVNAETQTRLREDAMARERREGAKNEEDLGQAGDEMR